MLPAKYGPRTQSAAALAQARRRASATPQELALDQAAGESDPGSCRFEHELDNLGHESVIESAAGRALEGRDLR